jgi:hypothetical protein
MLFFLPFFTLLVSSDAVLRTYYSNDVSCSGKPTVKLASNGDCASFGEPYCTNFINITGVITTCPGAVIFDPDWASIQVWASSTTCQGIPDYIIAMPANTCSGYWQGPTMSLDCASSSVRDCQGYIVPTCDECPSHRVDNSGRCTIGNPTSMDTFSSSSYVFTCPRVCHEHGEAVAEAGKPSSAATDAILIVLLLSVIWFFC